MIHGQLATQMDKLDSYGMSDPDNNEGHPEDRCSVCEWPMCDHPGQFGWDNLPPRAKWPHRRAALAALLAEWWDRKLTQLLRWP